MNIVVCIIMDVLLAAALLYLIIGILKTSIGKEELGRESRSFKIFYILLIVLIFAAAVLCAVCVAIVPEK